MHSRKPGLMSVSSVSFQSVYSEVIERNAESIVKEHRRVHERFVSTFLNYHSVCCSRRSSNRILPAASDVSESVEFGASMESAATFKLGRIRTPLFINLDGTHKIGLG